MMWIPVAEAREGMILARDVVTPSGQVVMSRGAGLDGQIIGGLVRHHIISIAVCRDDASCGFSEEEIAGAEAACEDMVRERFPKDLSEDLMQRLFRAVLRIEALERLSNGSEDQQPA